MKDESQKSTDPSSESSSTEPSATLSKKKTSHSLGALDSGADLVDVKIIEKHRQSVLVEYQVDGMPYRATVDADDLVDGQCPRERLGDAPHGITWEFNFDLDVLSHDTEFELKRNGIWTYADLVINDRQINRIASILLSRAIWSAAKRGCNRRP